MGLAACVCCSTEVWQLDGTKKMSLATQNCYSFDVILMDRIEVGVATYNCFGIEVMQI